MHIFHQIIFAQSMDFKDINNTFRDYSLFLFQFKLVLYVVFFRVVRKVFGAVGIVPEIDIIVLQERCTELWQLEWMWKEYKPASIRKLFKAARNSSSIN